MFTRIVTVLSIAAAITIAAAPSFASEATIEEPQVFTSSLSRDDVQRVAIAARNAGLVSHGEAGFVAEVATGASKLSRAQVLAELKEARRLGLVGGGERNLFATPEQTEQIRVAGLKAVMPMVAAR